LMHPWLQVSFFHYSIFRHFSWATRVQIFSPHETSSIVWPAITLKLVSKMLFVYYSGLSNLVWFERSGNESEPQIHNSRIGRFSLGRIQKEA
jgi:hypothetical protein